ncbi:hypothetical protein pipiens_018960, partial [Culex pipiens pipiens]
MLDGCCIVRFPENKKGVGIYNVTFNNVHYCEYLGVRYATAARFKDPVLYKPKYQEQYNREGSICPQMNELSYADSIHGDEDCLFLNIYGPQYDGKKAGFGGFPVLVFIHGGSFQLGSASFEFSGADLLVEKETIVITMNYRLSVLGFLHYPPYNITGNYGLKDQQAALKWINQYVKFFGGDPNRVTLMGQSAGAAAVSYHLYSDRSRGLFQQAALLSGSFLAPWAYTYRPEYFAEQYFKATGITSRQQLYDRNASDLIMLNDSIGHTAPIFLYRFDFDGKFGMYKNDVIKSQLIDTRYGAVHGDDLGYIFNPYILREALNRKKNYQKEWMVHDRMSEMVANFVKFGNPSLEDFQWTAYNAESDQKQYA